MRTGVQWKVRHLKSFLMCLLCIAVVAATVVGAADVATAATASPGSPQILSFTAQPMVLPDGAFAVYEFEVRNATGLKLIEAGDIINAFSGPPLGLYKGKANGRTTFQIRKVGMNYFDAILVAVNPEGSQQRSLRLSFATKSQQIDGSKTLPVDIPLAKLRKPEWQAQTSLLTRTAPATGQIVSAYPPPFEKCSKDCDYCLQPSDAAARGFTQQCSKGPCYYSPDKQEYWYCYKKPDTVWCCLDGTPVEVTKDACARKGGTAYPTEAEALKYCAQPGYCCLDGSVSRAPLQARCLASGGSWFPTEKEAIDACQSLIWCCLDGKPVQTTKESCYKRSGTAYPTEAEALKYCTQQGYCCINGSVSPAPLQARCLASGGSWFLTEKQAIDACQTNIWCCRDGKIMQTSKELCDQMGGSGYASQADAANNCQQQGYCCVNGSVTPAPLQARCLASGGSWFATEKQAVDACQAQGYCCVNGSVSPSPLPARCMASGGSWFPTEKQAIDACQSLVWCCLDGTVVQNYREACYLKGGTAYASQAEAARYCQQASNCYCCVDGKTSQMSTAMCTRYGGRCYSTLAEAAKYCQPPVTNCYCCVNGNVSQMSTAMCTRYQGTCYSTLDAANKSCLKVITPPTLYQPPKLYTPPTIK